MELIRDTIKRFKDIYGCEPEFVVTAPGRVNLLGEHTDYNDGFVLPIAIDKKIIVAVSRRQDNEVHLHAIDMMQSVCVPLNGISYQTKMTWANYPFGVLKGLEKMRFALGGLNMCYRGTIPMGAGLSSSAAVEVACTLAFSRLFENSISMYDSIRVAQQAETEFVGVSCGIMDQFVSVMGKKHHALFLDCRSLEHKYIPCPKGYRLVICDTGIKRELARSEYNMRRQDCKEAVNYFATLDPSVKSLRDVTVETFHREEKNISPVLRDRAKHVIMENARVERGAKALERGDVSEFGKLMIDSHISLRDLYDVSCPELDTFVDVAIECEGVYGARMTGAGFGGCGICLVTDTQVDELVEHVRHEYQKVARRSLAIYVASIEDGATVYDMTSIGMPVHVANQS